VNIDYTLTNDTASGLPLTIDTKGLKQIIAELSQYQDPIKMSLRLHMPFGQYAPPTVSTDIDGTILKVSVGLDFGLWNSDSNSYDTIITTDLHLLMKFLLVNDNDKLDIRIMAVKFDKLDIKDKKIEVDSTNMLNNLNKFFALAVKIMKPMLDDYDIVNSVNFYSGSNYTTFDVNPDHSFTSLVIY
jgi:hypothetical protein